MFDNLTTLGYGLVLFAIVLGVGSVVMYNFAVTAANCASGSTYNASSSLCTNASGTGVNPSQATQNMNYLTTNLGSTGGGLASWTPAIIAVSVGFLFLAMFGFGGKGRKGKY